jgi:hypothetical protein
LFVSDMHEQHRPQLRLDTLVILISLTSIDLYHHTLQLHLSKAAPITETPFNKYFNLQELEDKEQAVTEVLLNSDNTVTVGETDGPLFASAAGTWSSQGDSFQMTLRRTYSAGSESSSSTDMGEFSFTVERTFTGTLYMVGAKLAVEGSVHSVDEHGDNEVGYFEMIDVTKERAGEKDEF